MYNEWVHRDYNYYIFFLMLSDGVSWFDFFFLFLITALHYKYMCARLIYVLRFMRDT